VHNETLRGIAKDRKMNNEYESPIKALLESLEEGFANTVNPKGSLEIEQLVVEGYIKNAAIGRFFELSLHSQKLVRELVNHLASVAPVNFKQFQATRKKVTAPYGYMDDITDDIETAFTYMGTFERFIEESYHISIWTNEELIKKHGGKYCLILMNCEYNSNDLEQLEKMLFEFIQEN